MTKGLNYLYTRRHPVLFLSALCGSQDSRCTYSPSISRAWGIIHTERKERSVLSFFVSRANVQ